MNWFERWLDWVRGLKQEAHALYLACRDRRCPWPARLLGAAVLAYALSPINLIPDFVPVLGLLDDLVLVPLGLLLVHRLIPSEVLDDARLRAGEEDRPALWVAAAAVAAVWVVLVGLTLFAVLGWH